MMNSHKTHFVFIVIGFLTILGALWLIWSSVVDGRLVRKPIVVYDNPKGYQIQTDKLLYEQGEIVYGLIKYCKNRNIEMTFQWTLVDTYLKTFPEHTSTALAGCHEVLMQIEQIPADQYPDSDLYFESALQFRINNFNTVVVPVRTNTFRVR